MGKKVLVVDDDPDVRMFNITVLEENGYTPIEAIQAATKLSAELCGLSHLVGTIEKGKVADLIAVPGDPLENLAVLNDIRLIIQEGNVVTL